MRIQLKFSSAKELVPNNLKHVVSYIHKCLGKDNLYHNQPSNYVISRMIGGTITEGGTSIEYAHGGSLFISSGDESFLNKLLAGAGANKDFGFGMKLTGIEFIQEDLYDGFTVFKTTETGILLKKKNGGRYEFHTLNDDGFEEELSEQTKRRLSNIDNTLKFDGFRIEVQKSNHNKVRDILMSSSGAPSKTSVNKANVCSVVVHCNKKIAQAIHDYGLGQSTGIGFGMVMEITNSKLYI